MRNKLFKRLQKILKKDQRLIAGNSLLRNKIMELTYKEDEGLIKLLLSDDDIKDYFFNSIDDIIIFDKDKFVRFINNKQFLPDSYTIFKNKIGLIESEEYIDKKNEVCLAWPYKDCVLEGNQANPNENREEIFWNKILAPDEVERLEDPKVLTNFKRIDEDGEHTNIDLKSKNNLLLKGNNLLALHTIKSIFRNKIKLIYIDPPFNTGSDEFNYNDRFNHSTWLTFMKNRLEVAQELLREDGVIFVHIDDNELAHLKLILDEIFDKAPSGKDNFVQFVEIKANEGAANEYQNPFMPKNCEYGLIYAKNYDKRKYKPIWVKSEIDEAYNKFVLNPEEDYINWEISTVKKEFDRRYSSSERRNNSDQYYDFVLEHIDQIFRTISPKGPGKGLKKAMVKSNESTWAIYKRNDKEDILCYKGEMVRFYSKNLKEDINENKIIARELGSLWTDISWTGIANEGEVKLKYGKKPEKLLRRIIYQNTKPGEIVLDFFLGSGTTAAVAHKMNRRYIGIEQLDYGKNSPLVRLKNVINGDQTGISKEIDWEGGGEFIYAELMEWNQKYIEQIESANSENQLLNIWDKMQEESFLSYKVDPNEINKNIDEFKNLSFENKCKFLLKCIDENHLYVNFSEINDEEYNISRKDKKLNKQFFEDDLNV